MDNIGFIGLGNMGSAILKSLAKNTKDNMSIGIFDTCSNKVEELSTTLTTDQVTVKGYSSIEDLVKNCSIVILCIKPQVFSKISSDIFFANTNDCLFISILAGVTTSTLANELKSDRIVRVMPNLAARCDKAVTAVTAYEKTNEVDKNEAFKIAQSFGSAFFLDEDKFSAFIGISGSAIAFVFEFAHAIALGGTHEGIAYNTSLDIAFETMESARALYQVDKENPISLMSKVCSAGGTTIEGIKTLSENKFTSAVMNSVIDASKKSKELEKR